MKKIDRWAFFIFLATLVIYIHNLSPSIFGGDSGDLVSAALAKGVPHPSGYPLYTMLGILFLKLPISATPAWKVGLISALFSSVSVVLMYLIVKRLTKNKYLSVLTSLTLAFLYPFWLYAEVAEVFALHSFFILLISYFTISYWQSKKLKYLYLTAFSSGLSLTNNQVILLFFPATAYLLIATQPKILKNLKTLTKSFAFFLIGLVPYAYIPIAASFDPAVNWGSAVTLKNFLTLISRRLYGWGGNPLAKYAPLEALKPMFYYWKLYISPLIPFFSLMGIVYFLRNKKHQLLIYFLLAFSLLGPIFLVYGHRTSVDAVLRLGIIERFLIQSAIISVFFVPFGMLFTLETVKNIVRNENTANLLRNLTLVVFALIPLASFVVNFTKTNLKAVFIGDNLAKDILTTAPTNSLFLFSTDHYIFNTVYYQLAYGERDDIAIPGAHSGFGALIEELPQLANQIDISEYSISRANLIDNNILLLSLLSAIDNREVYVDVGVGLEITEGLTITPIPYGLINKLQTTGEPLPEKEEFLEEVGRIWDNYHLEHLKEKNYIVSENLILSDIRGVYVLSLLRTAEFIRENYDDPVAASRFELMALELDPLSLIRRN